MADYSFPVTEGIFKKPAEFVSGRVDAKVYTWYDRLPIVAAHNANQSVRLGPIPLGMLVLPTSSCWITGSPSTTTVGYEAPNGEFTEDVDAFRGSLNAGNYAGGFFNTAGSIGERASLSKQQMSEIVSGFVTVTFGANPNAGSDLHLLLFLSG